jgi:hypothetical protein
MINTISITNLQYSKKKKKKINKIIKLQKN